VLLQVQVLKYRNESTIPLNAIVLGISLILDTVPRCSLMLAGLPTQIRKLKI